MSSEIVFGGLRLDPVSRRVWRDEKEVKLTMTEYSLIEHFIRNPNRPISREEISEHIWDSSASLTFTNIIDVYVYYLRKKIDRDVDIDRRLIHTVRGVGYMLKEEN